jgi:prophage regulatory protein
MEGCLIETRKQPGGREAATTQLKTEAKMTNTNGLIAAAPTPQPDDRAPAELMPRKMLNEKQVLQLVPIARSTLWRMEKQGKFPRGSYILPGRKVWFADEITAWQTEIEGQPGGRRRKGRKPR